MAHTSDRTLLAALGFQDPDKRDKRHTLACQYLCEPETAVRMWERLFPGCAEPRPSIESITLRMDDDADAARSYDIFVKKHPFPNGHFELKHMAAKTEVGIYRARGHVVGFWDVVLGATTVYGEWSGPHLVFPTREFTGRDGTRLIENTGSTPIAATYDPKWFRAWRHPIYIEVKASPVDVSGIARQLDLYREFTPGVSAVVVATCYPMTAADKATLSDKSIRHVYLGDGFKAYCALREAEVAEEEPGL